MPHGGQFSWERNGAPERCLDLLDDPHSLYLPSVEHALELLNNDAPQDDAREAVPAALPTMVHWITRLRGAPGPAAMLGELLICDNDHLGASLAVRVHADASGDAELGGRARRKVPARRGSSVCCAYGGRPVSLACAGWDND